MQDDQDQRGASEPVVWQCVEWRQGDGRYRFEVAQGGLHATLTSPHGCALTLPVIAWDALLDALAAARKTKSRTVQDLPPRAGARWTSRELDELASAFKTGATVQALARSHSRTAAAIEAQLMALGLWEGVQGGPAHGRGRRPRSEIPPGWPPEPPMPAYPERLLAQVRPSSG